MGNFNDDIFFFLNDLFMYNERLVEFWKPCLIIGIDM